MFDIKYIISVWNNGNLNETVKYDSVDKQMIAILLCNQYVSHIQVEGEIYAKQFDGSWANYGKKHPIEYFLFNKPNPYKLVNGYHTDDNSVCLTCGCKYCMCIY